MRKVMVIGVCMLLCGIAPFSAAAAEKVLVLERDDAPGGILHHDAVRVFAGHIVDIAHALIVVEIQDLGVVHEVREKENDKAVPAALLCTSSAVGVMLAGALIRGTVRRHRSRRQDS